MTLLYVPYVPSKTESLILASRHIQADQHAYLFDCLPKGSPLRRR